MNHAQRIPHRFRQLFCKRRGLHAAGRAGEQLIVKQLAQPRQRIAHCRLAERMDAPFELRDLVHPVKLPKIAINMFWHAKFHKDPANQWLRSLVFDLDADASTCARA